jgi:hypothetical protein
LRLYIHSRFRIAGLRRFQITQYCFIEAQYLVAILVALLVRELKITHRRQQTLFQLRPVLVCRSQSQRFHSQFQIGILAPKLFRCRIRFREAARQRLERFLRNGQLLSQLFVLLQQRLSRCRLRRAFNFGS